HLGAAVGGDGAIREQRDGSDDECDPAGAGGDRSQLRGEMYRVLSRTLRWTAGAGGKRRADARDAVEPGNTRVDHVEYAACSIQRSDGGRRALCEIRKRDRV